MSQGFVNPQTITLPLPVTDGGTGASSATAYAVLCGGTTSTAAHQSIAGVGTSGQVLTSNGAGALPTFKTTAAGNVVQTVDTTNRSTTSTTFVTSNISATITPSSNTNRVRVTVAGCTGASTTSFLDFTLYRGATPLTPSGVNSFSTIRIGSNADLFQFVIDYVDSPATTSATTYTLYFSSSSGTGYIGRRGADTSADVSTTVTLEEIT